MLERAKGCLEHGGRQLLRLPGDPATIQRLRPGFWCHGAGDLDLSANWLALLSPTSDDIVSRGEQSNVAANISGAGFLDFLYPAKTLEILHKLNSRQAAHSRNHLNGLKNTPASRTYIRRRKQAWMNQEGDDEVAEYEQENASGHATSSAHGADDHHGSSWQKEKERREKGNFNVSIRHSKPTTRTLRVPSTALDHERQTGIKAQQARSEDTTQLEDEFQSRRKYEDRLSRFSQLLTDLREEQNASPSAVHELLMAGRDVLHLGAATLRHARQTFLDRMQSQDFQKWTDAEWQTNMRLLSMGSQPSRIFLDAFAWAVENGKVSTIMPFVAEHLVRSDWTALKEGRVFGVYERHRKRNASNSTDHLPPFWDWILSGHDKTVEQLAEDFLYQLRKRRYGTKHLDRYLLDYILEVYACIIRHKSFSGLDLKQVKSLRDRLRKVLDAGAKHGRLSYDGLHLVLGDLLFQRSFREQNGLLAFSVFQAMERLGGYRGGQPDLARKLFWRLANVSYLPGVKSVFSNLHLRGKINASEYSYVLFRLSQSGRDQEFKELQTQFERAQDSFGRPLHRSIGGRSRLQLYHDRLEIFRRRNDVPAMLDIYQQIKADQNVHANTETYNLLISGHARVEDVNGAEIWLAKLFEAGLKPDLYSFVPFMQLFARSGDIDAVRDITKKVEARGIPLDDVVIRCHLRALVLADALTDAKNLLSRLGQFHISVKDKARLYDEVVYAYALKGDQTQVQYLMNEMQRQDLEFTARTHASRMRLWCSRLEPAKADQELRHLLEKGGSSAYQCAIVMKGYLDAGLHHKSIEIFDLMIQSHIRPDWSIKRVVVEILENARSGRFELNKVHRMRFQKLVASSDPSDFASEGPFLEDPMAQRDDAYLTMYFQFLASVAPGSNEIDRVSYAWDAYIKYIEGQGTAAADFVPPMSIMSRLLQAFRRNKAWDRVEFCWNTIYKKAVSLGSIQKLTGTAFSRRFILCKPLYHYMQSLAEQGMLNSKVKPLISSILNKGFVLDSACWNQFIRLLVLDGSANYELAFQTAETTIMRGWRGWPGLKSEDVDSGKDSKSLRWKILKYAQVQKRPRRECQDLPSYYSLPLPKASDEFKSQHGSEDGGSDNGPFSTRGHGLPHASENYAVGDADLGSEVSPLFEEIPSKSDKPEFRKQGQSRYSLLFDGPTSAAAFGTDEGQLYQRLVQDEGHTGSVGIIGRPDYSTLVYLTRAFLDMRVGAAFDSSTRLRIKELTKVAPTLVQAVLTMPRVDDRLQLTLLRRQ